MIAAIDCDLRTSYCVTDTGLVFRAADPQDILAELVPVFRATDTVLFEIASPVSFNRGASGNAAMTQLAKWAIWNVARAAHCADWCWIKEEHAPLFLVAPSDVWTRGFDLKTRHAMAKGKQPKKDLRECEAMLWFYQHRPQDWRTLPAYLASL